jgi:DNA-binding PadR family transcriptional regulator
MTHENDTCVLTDHEGTFLSLVLRIGPTTAYQVSKIYADSPVSNFNTSKGKIYPLIKRLAERGMLERLQREAGERGELLRCTAAGKAALREWVREVRASHLLLEDPLRTKVQSFDLLSGKEQIEWVRETKAAMEAHLGRLQDYEQKVTVPYHTMVHANAVRSMRARIDWLEQMPPESVSRPLPCPSAVCSLLAALHRNFGVRRRSRP